MLSHAATDKAFRAYTSPCAMWACTEAGKARYARRLRHRHARGAGGSAHLALCSPLPSKWLPLSLAEPKAPCTLSEAVFTASLALWPPFSRAFSDSSPPCTCTRHRDQGTRGFLVLGALSTLLTRLTLHPMHSLSQTRPQDMYYCTAGLT